ncbi:MAG: hypothetical protein JSS86_04595 [Cyanobacteria bacterium SZAS LIN-2]|nr:hypothetical protein [Cyanobacteria bacterium SZAS LIN-2]MBS2009541.1 hypothetical protein [Cyanobacteria bacterium SZAS TMP-1]
MAIITQGPTAYIGTSVFAFHDGKVKQVLATGSKLMPEFVYPSKFIAQKGTSKERQSEAKIEPRITTTASVKFTDDGMIPETAHVFEWDETTNAYVKHGPVEWDKRVESF